MSQGSTSFHLNAQESVSWAHILSKTEALKFLTAERNKLQPLSLIMIMIAKKILESPKEHSLTVVFGIALMQPD